MSPSISSFALLTFLVKFKRLHRVMGLLLVNERSYLTGRTVEQLLIGSATFESTKDRSIQIAGQFPITSGSLGPVSIAIQTLFHS